MGIALANFPEFALWTFLSGEQQASMPTADVDSTVRYLQYLLVDGKFYTIFSILFGIGFSLILAHHGPRLFLRRMAVLVLIGCLHLMFIWSGHAMLYAVSVIPMALGYVALICLFWLHRPDASVWRWLAAPGRMALTCYIGQSVVGIILFYGIGFGLGTSFGLIHVELTALAVFLLETMLCLLWLRHFRYGPLEWLWRLATYGHYFPIVKDNQDNICA